MFLTLIVIGLVGLGMMALPAFGRHGGHSHHHAGGAPGQLGHGGHGGHAIGPGHATPSLPAATGGAHGAAAGGGAAHGPGVESTRLAVDSDGPIQTVIPHAPTSTGLTRFVPSLRATFSVLALYGAFGNVLVHAAHLPLLVAALVAAIPALAIERLAVRPLFNLVFRFEGPTSSPLETLLLTEARAVTPFRNGRGIVSVLRDGRAVQLSAQLRPDQATLPVKVGERLRVEDVDAAHERLTVSLLRD